jgi:hypothetical protein
MSNGFLLYQFPIAEFSSNAAQDLREKIEELERLLLSGETTVSIDGTTTTIDLDVIRQNLSLLYRQRDQQLGVAERKPRMSSIRVGGLF